MPKYKIEFDPGTLWNLFTREADNVNRTSRKSGVTVSAIDVAVAMHEFIENELGPIIEERKGWREVRS